MYFSYCPECGFLTHETAKEAKAEAQESLDIAMGDGPIPEWATRICWGKVHGAAEETSRRDPDPESHYESDFEYIATIEIVDDPEITQPG